MILPDVSYGELKTFVTDLYYHHPHFGWSYLDIPQPRKLVTEEEDDCEYPVANSTPFSEAELDFLDIDLAASVSRDDNNNSAEPS